jgi:hypothetical protein
MASPGLSVLRCATGEDKVASFDDLVAGKSGVVRTSCGLSSASMAQLNNPTLHEAQGTAGEVSDKPTLLDI